MVWLYYRGNGEKSNQVRLEIPATSSCGGLGRLEIRNEELGIVMDRLVRAITADGMVQAVAVTTRALTERARQIHKTLPVGTRPP